MIGPNHICKFMTLSLEEYYLIPGNNAINLLRQIFISMKKMELFSCKMTHLKFVFVVSITASAQVIHVIKVDI